MTGTETLHRFLLPDLGEGLTEAEIVTWLVAPGDLIVIDQPVVEVESAKSVVELPSPYAGRVQTLDAEKGQTVTKGSALLTIASSVSSPVDASGRAPLVSAPEPPVGSGTGAAAARSGPAGSGAAGSGAVLVGYGTRESTMRLIRPAGGRFGNHGAGASGAAAVGTISLQQPVVVSGLLDPSRRSPVVSPIVRALARTNGFDASHLVGSAPGDIVRRTDVAAAIVARAAVSDPASAPPASPTGRSAEQDVRIPLTGMRKLIAARLSESRRVVPEVTLWLDVDVTALLRAKDRLQHVTGERFSLTSLIARFAVAGLQKYPILNSSVDESRNEIVQHASVNLGIAAQTPRGLMVPVIHGAQLLTTRQLRDGIGELVATAAKGDFAPAALSGGTFTLNNYGGFGVDGSTPIINYPEVAMLGIGRIKERPWVVDGELAVRSVMVVTFVFDHRVCDGDVASGFLTTVAGYIEEPLLLLGDL